MKNLLAILSAIIVFASCSDKAGGWHSAPELRTAHGLMQERPDSALKVLIGFGIDNSMSRSITNEYQILVAEALYKNDCAQTNRQKVIDAVRFFDSLTMKHPDNDDITMLSARSHYINGVGLYENDSVEEACEEFLNALCVMEKRFDEKDLTGHRAKFMALTYNRLADLFSGQLMTEPAIGCLKKSIHFCKIEPTSKYGISKSYSFIGKQYDMMDKRDSASIYYRMALEEFPDRDNIAYRDLFSLIVLNNYYSSKSDVWASIDSMRMIAAQAATEQERMTRSLALGTLFNEAGQYDSAALYFMIIRKEVTSYKACA